MTDVGHGSGTGFSKNGRYRPDDESISKDNAQLRKIKSLGTFRTDLVVSVYIYVYVYVCTDVYTLVKSRPT